MTLADTHCHIHSADYALDPEVVLRSAQSAGVERLLCVGTDAYDSELAAHFAAQHEGCFASVGLHPHEARHHATQLPKIREVAHSPRVVAIGECGLDYYYDHSPHSVQRSVLEKQLVLAKEHDLPLIFHVRDAFDDFWPPIDAFPGIKGVVHGFSATTVQLEPALSRNLYIRLNGIMTFTKNTDQLAAARAVPLNALLLETDAPYLTPPPFRGKINESKHLVTIAAFLASLRGETIAELATATTANARSLFGI